MQEFALPPGYLVQRYEILRVLGYSGYAFYYIAKHPAIGIEVMVKELFPADLVYRDGLSQVVPRDVGYAKDFSRTKQLYLESLRDASNFNHSGVLKILEVMELHSTIYVISEFVDGLTFGDWIKLGSPPEAMLRMVTIHLLRALGAIHQSGLLHQNIDPTTIRIRKGTELPVLMDFYFRTELLPNDSTAIKITPRYSAFESFQSKGRTGPPTDIYSLGAVLYLAVTGNPPISAVDRVEDDRLQPLAEQQELKYSQDFLRSIDKALRFRFSDRWQSVREWLEALGVPGNVPSSPSMTEANMDHDSENPTPKPFDVFISHSAEDKLLADALCAILEQQKLRCWIAPRDILPGNEWGESIVEGIENSRMMVILLSRASNQSTYVLREVERAVSGGLTIVPVRIESVLPSKKLTLFLSATHWLDAITSPVEGHFLNLAKKLKAHLALATPLKAEMEPNALLASQDIPPVAKMEKVSQQHVDKSVPVTARRRTWSKVSLAAAIVLLLGLGILFQQPLRKLWVDLNAAPAALPMRSFVCQGGIGPKNVQFYLGKSIEAGALQSPLKLDGPNRFSLGTDVIPLGHSVYAAAPGYESQEIITNDTLMNFKGPDGIYALSKEIKLKRTEIAVIVNTKEVDKAYGVLSFTWKEPLTNEPKAEGPSEPQTIIRTTDATEESIKLKTGKYLVQALLSRVDRISRPVAPVTNGWNLMVSKTTKPLICDKISPPSPP